MELVEIRDLDGPNLFRMEPVIKIGLVFDPDDSREALVRQIGERIAVAHDLAGEPRPQITSHSLDNPNEWALAFDWRWRRFAFGAARFAAALDLKADDPAIRDGLLERLKIDRQEHDGPLWVRDAERTARCVGITGTNGKTTTTRLLAHIAMCAGRRVGWSSSTGVYINGEQVLEGDYSGPSGARRALLDPEVDLAVLETARGGLLQRGLAYESNDVSVFLNVAADHLSLHGIETVESLAEVKGVVVRVTRPEGLVVLCADDPLVLAFKERVKAPVLLFSQYADRPEIRGHITHGKHAVVRDGDAIISYRESVPETIARLSEVPITFGGAAPFMVENAMAASGAAIGLGFTIDEIAEGLKSFQNDSRSNKGRLNVFDVGGRTAIIDYAHNDTGLLGLTAFSRSLVRAGQKLHLIIGTAGDRRDQDLLALGRIARRDADVVYLKDTPGYFRGREAGDMPTIMRKGFEETAGGAALAGAYENEASAFVAALDSSSDGDVIAVMCQVDQDRMIEEILRRGGSERTNG